MGRKRNELRNIAGLILNLRIIVAVQELKNSFYKQILVLPHFWLVPPHFICSGVGTVLTIPFLTFGTTYQSSSLQSLIFSKIVFYHVHCNTSYWLGRMYHMAKWHSARASRLDGRHFLVFNCDWQENATNFERSFSIFWSSISKAPGAQRDVNPALRIETM